MKSVRLDEVARATGGRLAGPADLRVKGVETDSRRVRSGCLFVAMRGERRDGHRFIRHALSNGAVAVLAEERAEGRRSAASGIPAVFVPDTQKALGDLAGWVRGRLRVTCIGITGSTGKTSTKDFLVSSLKKCFPVAASPGSYNNEVGIPLTIFGAGARDRFLVAEMGARHVGDITRLAEMVRPEMGIITNVGVTHLELFGSVERIAKAKGELAEALPRDGILFLNAENEWSRYISTLTSARVVRFGKSRSADYRYRKVELDEFGRPRFELLGPGFNLQVRLSASGRHQVMNALAAGACASELGVTPEALAEGLSEARVSQWRTEIRMSPGGRLVINDAYNASPHSMRAALETLASVRGESRSIAVLGDMAELGRESVRFHREVGRDVVEKDVDILIAVGKLAAAYASAALEEGMPRGSVFRCADAAAAAWILAQISEPGDVVLVKGSRVMGLDRLAGELLKADFPRRGKGARSA